MSEIYGTFSRDKTTGKVEPVQPLYTLPGGCTEANTSTNQDPCFYGLGPGDFAKIYNVTPLWNSNPSINGSGQTIAIVGETDINVQDAHDFRSLFGLPENDPVKIFNGPNPGLQSDEVEANLDVQWSGGVAPGATIDFVASQSTETTAGVDLSAVYIVESNLAGVMSESYGYCELFLGASGNLFYNNLWQQASAQGISVFIAAGDNGSAGCDNFDAASPAPAQYGLQVSGFASTPYNVAVGGTDFDDFFNPSKYWSTTNDPTTGASALSYIPETTWNSSCTNAIFGKLGWSTNPELVCNDPNAIPHWVKPLGGSGGSSACTSPTGSTCSGGYARPAWQSAPGAFSSDGKRDIPDVSLFASPGFLQNFYIVCQSDATHAPCSLSPTYYFLGVGGTSASSPAFAGIMALVDQKTGERQGNPNYVLYKLAGKQSASSCNANSTSGPASSCIFNDITAGTNAMPCKAGTLNCNVTNQVDTYGILTGYNAGSGYDLATGLGSVNAQNLVTQWNSSTATLTPTVTLSSSMGSPLTHGRSFQFTVTVSGSGTGAPKPTAPVALEVIQNGITQSLASFPLTNGSTTNASTDLLPGGSSYNLTAHYPGDSNYTAADSSPLTVTVNKENSSLQVELATFNWNGTPTNPPYTMSAVYGSPYLLRVNVENSAGQMCVPPPLATTQTPATGCPTGTVTLTNNGGPLDSSQLGAGIYPLNTYGYFEDQAIQLPGGTNAVAAAYAGDNSFISSNGNASITITPAPTSVIPPNPGSSGTVGNQININTQVQAHSSGVAPTGTVTFFANGSPIAGTASYAGSTLPSNQEASLNVSFASTTSPFTAPGSYTITAQYNGDTNYAPSPISEGIQIGVKYSSPNVSVTPSNPTLTYGSTATITVLIDSSNKTTYPTGTVTLGNNVAGPTACANATDLSGNFACQVVFSFTVTSAGSFEVQYSGDQNYPSAYGWANINMPDFNVNMPSSAAVSQGQQSSPLMINVSGLDGFSGMVNFSCSGLPAETQCNFSTNPLNVTGPGSSTQLTFQTTPLGQSKFLKRTSHNEHRTGLIGLTVLPLVGLCLIGIPVIRRSGGAFWVLMIASLIVMLPSCGGGGTSGVGGGTPNPQPSITSFVPDSVAAGSQQPIVLVNGTNFVFYSTVMFNGTLRLSSYVSATQLSVQLQNSDVAATGAFPVTVTNPPPGGGTSAAQNFAVVTGTPTGIFPVTVTATGPSGTPPHTTNVNLTVQ